MAAGVASSTVLSTVHIPVLTSIKPAIEWETTEYLLLLEIFSLLGYYETRCSTVSFLPLSPPPVDWLCGVQISLTQRGLAFSLLPGLLRVDYATLAPASLLRLPPNHCASLGSSLFQYSLGQSGLELQSGRQSARQPQWYLSMYSPCHPEVMITCF